MSPKRGDRAAPPPTGDAYDLWSTNTEAAEGWEHLGRQAARNLRRAFEKIRTAPRATDNPDRQHRLKGKLGTATFKGQTLERWQYEVTGGGRIWYLLDDANRTAWIHLRGHLRSSQGHGLIYPRTGAISRYGSYMVSKKVTITLDESLVEAMTAAAKEAGVPLSRLVASAAERELRLRAGRAVVREWQAEHGVFTPEELAAARAELAAADAEHLGSTGAAAA